MNNIGISVNDKFIDGALTLIFSIKKHNSFDFKLYVVDIDISKTNKLLLKRLHSDIEFVSIPDKELYLSKIVLSTPQDNSNDLCIRDGFYRFELFKLPIEKIVYLDCDMLCLGNIEELFNLKEQFSACYIETPHQIQGKLQDIKSLFHFNTGMMVIGEKYLGNTNYYNELVSLISNFVPPNDETILNYFFSCKNDINYINYKYNTPL
jgi:lipopolysaccharide biosynthesis glycosyltransferase